MLWHCLLRVLNHGTQYRSEAAALLIECGYSPGELDFAGQLRCFQRPIVPTPEEA